MVACESSGTRLVPLPAAYWVDTGDPHLYVCMTPVSQTMEDPAFHRLPKDLEHALLLQAFERLDQHQLLCVVTLVNKQWHKLVKLSSKKIRMHMLTEYSVEEYLQWLQKYGSALTEISVSCDTIRDLGPPPLPSTMGSLLSALSSCIHLQRLDVDTCPLTQEVAPLSSLTTLRHLELHECRLQLGDLQHIAALTNLTALHISYNEVDHLSSSYQQDMSQLAQSLQSLKVLHLTGGTLDLQNQPGPALAPLTAFRSLKQLHLRYGILFSSDLAVVPKQLPITAATITVVTDDANHTAHTCSWLKTFGPRLVSLHLLTLNDQPIPFPSAIFAAVQQCQQLEALYLPVWDLSALPLHQLSCLRKLRELDLDSCRVAAASLSALLSSCPLEDLTLNVDLMVKAVGDGLLPGSAAEPPAQAGLAAAAAGVESGAAALVGLPAEAAAGGASAGATATAGNPALCTLTSSEASGILQRPALPSPTAQPLPAWSCWACLRGWRLRRC